ncbi:hypothetical protein P9265_01725 [Schinkia azotoformans]|uniref:hypothetical protein n=1 Tax=Schinkia azotoformans TaxID=1454 RepID=UPI002E1C87DE|nr:hypothetical protein [Schinkia azotoformans]
MKTGVFIIESLDLENEEQGLFEGRVLREILNMLGVETAYVYIRTKKELKIMIKRFEKLNYKYLHLSCHGNQEGIAMTLDKYAFPFSEFSDMFDYYGDSKRLFLSSCSVMKEDNISKELLDTRLLSIAGPTTEIDFSDAAIFWASFYHQMFRENDSMMDNKHLKETLDKLSKTFDVDISLLILNSSKEKYNRYNYKNQLVES